MTQQTATAPATANGGAPADDLVGTGTLAAKLARIMGALDRIARDGKVSGSGGYSYASADALSDILRPALAAEGVVMLPTTAEVIEQRIDEIDKTDGGGKPYTQTRYTVALHVEWMVTDGETSYLLASVGTGVDYSGKAANAAHTFARVNALKSAFHLSTGEDVESAQHTSAPASGAAGGNGTGEMPTLADPGGVTGTVTWRGTDAVAIFFRAEDRADFDAIKECVKGIPGRRWDADGKVWLVPAAEARTAVVLGRYLDLQVAPALEETYPATQPGTVPASSPAGDMPGPTDADPGSDAPPPDDDSIPF